MGPLVSHLRQLCTQEGLDQGLRFSRAGKLTEPHLRPTRQPEWSQAPSSRLTRWTKRTLQLQRLGLVVSW